MDVMYNPNLQARSLSTITWKLQTTNPYRILPSKVQKRTALNLAESKASPYTCAIDPKSEISKYPPLRGAPHPPPCVVVLFARLLGWASGISPNAAPRQTAFEARDLFAQTCAGKNSSAHDVPCGCSFFCRRANVGFGVARVY